MSDGIQLYLDKTFNNVKILNNLIISSTATVVIGGNLTLNGIVTINGALIMNGSITSNEVNTWNGQNTWNGFSIFNNNIAINRANNTISRTLAFQTGGFDEWVFTLNSGGTSLSLTQSNSAISQNFFMTLGALGRLSVGGSFSRKSVTPDVPTVTTTLTTTQLLGGFVQHVAASNDNLGTPSAAQIVAAIPGLFVGEVFQLVIFNFSPANTVTLTPNANVGIASVGAAAIPAATTRTYYMYVINPLGTTNPSFIFYA